MHLCHLLVNSRYSSNFSYSKWLGVIKLLPNLKPYKASEPYKIPTRLLKECAKEIAPSLVLLYQASLKQSIVPTE